MRMKGQPSMTTAAGGLTALLLVFIASTAFAFRPIIKRLPFKAQPLDPSSLVEEDAAGPWGSLPNCTTYSTQAGCDGIEPEPNPVLPACGPFSSATSQKPGSGSGSRNKTAAFVVLGDYGLGTGNCQPKVSALVHELEKQFAVEGSLDFLFTTGDNAYWSGDCTSLQQNVGPFYGDYFTPNATCVNPSENPVVKQRINAAMAAEKSRQRARGGRVLPQQRFFPCIGNHDWDTYGPNYQSMLPFAQYFDYLSALEPSIGHGHFYTYSPIPSVQLFALNSNLGDPDAPAWEATLFQEMTAWLEQAVKASTARYKFVYFHHPPYCTAQHDPLGTWMRLPFSEWGVSAVFAGHQHVYERLLPPEDSAIPYIVQGLSGHPWIYEIHNCAVAPGSQIRYNSFHGAMLGIMSTDGTNPDSLTIDMCFYSLEKGGTVVDHFVL